MADNRDQPPSKSIKPVGLATLKEFLRLEAAGGVLLAGATVVALIVANSPLASLYNQLIDLPIEVRIGTFEIAKPMLLWVNDGLMAIFFFLVGLELKREIVEGQLSSMRQIALPGFAAVGGMAIPAAIYVLFNRDDPVALEGWAIPAATDIAFALAVLSLLGNRVPTAVKVLLVSVAIFDDLGAIIVIALFYTNNLSIPALLGTLPFIAILAILNRRGVSQIAPYAFGGLTIWVLVLKSGVHATLAGVLLAMFIPMRDSRDPSRSPLKRLEHDLHGVVAFAILPIFAFANAGISFAGIGMEQLLHPIPVGIAAGLFFGKQIGIVGFALLGLALGVAKMPKGLGYRHLYGVSLLCGVGFTMSLFIGSLAFEETAVNMLFDERLGILIGSFASGVVGYLWLRATLPKTAADEEDDEESPLDSDVVAEGVS